MDAIHFDFGSSCLLVKANPDDDSISLRVERPGDSEVANWINVSGHQPWKDHIGKFFGWGWITVNQQGYCDGVLLGFKGTAAEIILNVAASSIKTGSIVYDGSD